MLAVFLLPVLLVLLIDVPGRGLAYEQAAARGTAKGGGRVSLCKAHSHLRETVDVGRLIVVASRSWVIGVHQIRRADPALVVS